MAYHIESALKSWKLTGKRVLVRTDLNVPLHNGTITNDFRLRQAQRTIDRIIHQGGSAIIASHLGRPTKPDNQYSLKQLVPWFKKLGYSITLAESITQAHALVQSISPGSILLLENLRFFPGEQHNDHYFAQTIAKLADYYVDDAFGTLHRNESSIAHVPRFFGENARTIGLLVEHELQMLNRLLINPAHPFILILGGAKIGEKIRLIEHLLHQVDKILLCPALAFSFMHATGLSVGRSLIDPNVEQLCRLLLERTHKLNTQLILPIDFQVAKNNLGGELSIVEAHAIPSESIGVSIGPKTMELYTQEITQAKTVFYNGLMGFQEHPETLQGMHAILQAMANSHGYSVIGGGDTVSAAESMGLADRFGFCSTGGGATLTYLSGQALPGIEALIKPGTIQCSRK